MKKHVVSLLLLWGVVFGVWAEKGFVIQGVWTVLHRSR